MWQGMKGWLESNSKMKHLQMKVESLHNKSVCVFQVQGKSYSTCTKNIEVYDGIS